MSVRFRKVLALLHLGKPEGAWHQEEPDTESYRNRPSVRLGLPTGLLTDTAQESSVRRTSAQNKVPLKTSEFRKSDTGLGTASYPEFRTGPGLVAGENPHGHTNQEETGSGDPGIP